jgi:glucose-6-phosphate isomerase
MRQDAWKRIGELELRRLDQLFADEPDRLSRFSHDVAGLHFDWAKTHLDQPLVEAFEALAVERGFETARDSLFAGGIVNPTEGRSADHVAERGSGDADSVELAAARRSRMRALVDAIEAGAFGEISAILHIGIGGSVLGPHLLVDALGRHAGVKTAFLSNIDGQAFEAAVSGFDPATTLVIAASKTFTTAETLANLSAASDWLRTGGVGDPFGRVVAVTAAPDAALEAGIDESRILLFSEGVGGR